MSLLESFVRAGLEDAVLAETALAGEVFIAIRKDGHRGTGTENDPYDGAVTAVLNDIMGDLTGGETVRFGPGVFQTRGWEPKSGQRIIGSGMFVTTIKLLLSSATSGDSFHLIGLTNSVLSGYEVTDLTIDCNLAGQPDTGSGYPRIAVGAINLHGSNILIRRVRVINFGTNTPSWEYGVQNPVSVECFAIAVGFARPLDNPPPRNCVVDNCIVERPALSNARETTCINLSAGEDTILRRAYHEDCVIRNCYVNCEYVRATDIKPALRVQSLTRDGATATAILTTYQPHGRVVDDWIVVSGATEPAGETYQQLGLTARFNGSFKVTWKSLDGLSLKYVMDAVPASATAGGEIWLGKAPSALVTLAGIAKELVGIDYWVTLTTSSPHYRFLGVGEADGDFVLVQGIKTNGTGYENSYNGYYQVKEVPLAAFPSRMFKYKVGSLNPGDLAIDAGGISAVGAPFQGLSGDGGRRAVVERNRVYNCRIGGPYHDTYNTQSLIVRKNYYHNVNTGIYQNLGAGSVDGLLGAIGRVGPICTFTFPVGTTNPFAVGEVVQIVKAVPEDEYCGYHEVQSVSGSAFTFYDDTQNNPEAEDVYTVKRIYTVSQLMIEDNIIELGLFAPGTQSHAAPSGVTLIAPAALNDLPIIRSAIVRGNLIRHLGGLVDPCARGDSRGVDVSCCKSLIVESNLIGVEGANWAVRHYHCGRVKAFNNLSFAGQPIYALKWDVTPNVHTSEIRTQAEDLFLM